MMNPNRGLYLGMALLALAGFLEATYVFVAHALGYSLVCPFATGCDIVQDSPYALVFGIPASLLGMAGYAAFAALALAATRSAAAFPPALLALTALTAVEVGFTAYMAYLQVSVIHAICSWCMLSAAITAVLALLILSVWAQAGGFWRAETRPA